MPTDRKRTENFLRSLPLFSTATDLIKYKILFAKYNFKGLSNFLSVFDDR